MTFSGQGGRQPDSERLKPFQLIATGIALLRPRLQPVALVAAASWIASLSWTVYVTPEREPQLGFLAPLIASLLGAAAGALMIRSMLRPGTRWWLPDGGFLGYVALTTVIGLPLAYIVTGMGGTPTAELPPNQLMAMLVLGLVTLVAQVKLLLWFVGVLVHAPVHPADSWRRMRGAAVSYILASILVTMPPMAIAVLIAGSAPDAANNPASIVGVVMTLATVIAEVLSASVVAGLWKARGER